MDGRVARRRGGVRVRTTVSPQRLKHFVELASRVLQNESIQF